MWLCKVILFITFCGFMSTCKNCKEPFSPYLSAFKLNNEKADSIIKVGLYFYANNLNFNQVIDSIGVSKRQYNSDVEIEFYRKSDTQKTFKYKIFYNDNTSKEFKIIILNDDCENCNDCDERKYPSALDINGVRISNKGNVINLN